MRSSPGCLVTRSDSPVSSDSSTSMRPWPTIEPSTTTWSPGSSRSTSPSTTSAGSISWTAPSRSTSALGRSRIAILSMTRLARISWNRLMTVLAAITNTTANASSGLPEDQEQDAEEVEEVVDEVEDVVADDATVGAAGPHLHVVALSGRAAAVGLGRGQTQESGGEIVGGARHVHARYQRSGRRSNDSIDGSRRGRRARSRKRRARGRLGSGPAPGGFGAARVVEGSPAPRATAGALGSGSRRWRECPTPMWRTCEGQMCDSE